MSTISGALQGSSWSCPTCGTQVWAGHSCQCGLTAVPNQMGNIGFQLLSLSQGPLYAELRHIKERLDELEAQSKRCATLWNNQHKPARSPGQIAHAAYDPHAKWAHLTCSQQADWERAAEAAQKR